MRGAKAARSRHDWTLAALKRANAERSALAGPAHLLLALLDLPASDPARVALDAASVTGDTVHVPKMRRRWKGTRSTPPLQIVDGFARGLAVASGRRYPNSVDELVALCWHPELWLTFADPRRRIMRELGRLGAVEPMPPLPKWDPARFTQEAELDRSDLDRAVKRLMEAHPPGTNPKWGINYRPHGRAVIHAEAGIDLAKVVDSTP